MADKFDLEDDDECDVAPLCVFCARLQKNTPSRLTCEAYPKGIPRAIAVWKLDHRSPVKGDSGLTFVVNPKLEKDYDVWIDGVDALLGNKEKAKKQQRASLDAIAQSIINKEQARAGVRV